MNTRPTGRRWDVTVGIAFICFCLVLAALIMPNILGRTGSKVAKPQSDLSELTGAIDQFRLDCDRYPTTQEGLNALTVQPKGATGWHGPYLRKAIPHDPWGNPYVYKAPGPNGGGYEVMSYGSDGQPGGEGDAADIVNGSDT